MWLACYTEEEIAEAVGVDQSTINRQVTELCKSDIWQKSIVFSQYREPGWQPPIHDVWRAIEVTDAAGHPAGDNRK